MSPGHVERQGRIYVFGSVIQKIVLLYSGACTSINKDPCQWGHDILGDFFQDQVWDQHLLRR